MRYADIPIPASWTPVLDQLKPRPRVGVPADLPPMSQWMEAAFADLGERERHVLRQRWAEGKTLADVGQALKLTRERIRQIESIAVKRIARTAADAVDEILGWLDPERKPLLALVRVPSGADAPLKMCIALAAHLLDRAIKTKRAANDCWVIYDEAERAPLLREVRRLTAECRHMPVDTIEERLGVDDEGLDTLFMLFPGAVFPTVSGLVAFRWKKIDHVVAVARALHAAGIREWHTSQMSKALGMLSRNPRAYSSRRVIAIVTRPDKRQVFEHVGRRGEWRLAEFGDGFHDNFEAVTALLRKSRTPMHIHDIESLLDRSVERATIAALLRTQSRHFRLFGSSVYGLADKSYPQHPATEKWMARQMNGRDAVLLADLLPAAASAGIPPYELRGAATVSDRLSLIGGRGRAPFRVVWR